eukprot:CAMPEP_0119177104 /NCGR_PEP_ID=MMETSP1315-20130426/47734_1 /TAXON_ID=676789 /ORGANISM="Prasinoderma singularis, Strain RCC927" /LENGTH=45 /DNA_ID= /DNA_START= /DNA_END= /DNA_ORIENTATION=
MYAALATPCRSRQQEAGALPRGALAAPREAAAAPVMAVRRVPSAV